MGICCMAQETQIGVLYQPRGVGWGGKWEGGSKGRWYIYTYGWFMLRFDRKQQNSEKQLCTSLVAQTVKRLSTMRETWVRSLDRKDPLEKEMAIHSSTLAWKIPRTEEPRRLQFMGSQRVGHDWATSLSLFNKKY